MSHHRETVTADGGAPHAAGPHPHAVVSNGLVYCSGQVHIDPASGELIAGDGSETGRACASTTWPRWPGRPRCALEDAVRIAIYVTDISTFKDVNEAYGAYFPVRSARPHHGRCRRAPHGRRRSRWTPSSALPD